MPSPRGETDLDATLSAVRASVCTLPPATSANTNGLNALEPIFYRAPNIVGLFSQAFIILAGLNSPPPCVFRARKAEMAILVALDAEIFLDVLFAVTIADHTRQVQHSTAQRASGLLSWP